MKQSPSGTNSEYNQHVALKYQLYNSFFLSLPLGGVKDVGILIPVLAETCRTKLQQGATPKKILRENDLKDAQKETLEKIIIRSLFGNINASRNSA